MRYLVLVLNLVLLLTASNLQAQDAPPDIPPGEDRIEYHQEGDPAQYEGMLLDLDTSIRWTNKLRWYQFRLTLIDSEMQERLDATNRSWERRLSLVEESYTREIEGLRTDVRAQATTFAEELAEAQDTPWYETWTFGFITGTVISVVVVGITAYAVSSLGS